MAAVTHERVAARELHNHETVEDVDTFTVLLVVDLVAGDAAFVSVKVSAAFRTEPLVTPQLSSGRA